jgi:dTDP-4-amino-4,6-dideoxygalactose transaminase
MALTAQRSSARATTPIPFADCHITDEAMLGARRVMESGWVTMGAQTAAFEEKFAEYIGARHAVAVSSCTAAIELALRSMRLPKGARVLTSTMTFCGAVQAILHADLTPVLVDVDEVTGMPTPRTVTEAVDGHGAVSAMVVVHWAGDPADVTGLAAAAGLPTERVVEDAAHALGAELAGTAVGRGAAVCFSFYATKNLPVGEGGMVTTDDPERAAWLRSARLHGMSKDAWRRYLPGGGWRYDVDEAGLKANFTDLQAAVARGQLAHLDGWQQRRAEIAAQYDDLLQGVPGLRLPHRPAPGAGTHAWHLYAVRLGGSAANRDAVIERLGAAGIGTSVHFIPVHHLAYFAKASLCPPGGLPGADRMFTDLVSLPLYPRLSDAQVHRVCDVLTQVLLTQEVQS